MVEKRKSPRFALETEIRWKNAGPENDGTTPHVSRTRDLSTGGTCLDLYPGISAGDTLQLEIRLPGNQTIRSTARVAWVNTQAQIKGWAISVCEAGVEFLDLNELEKADIDRFIFESFQI